MTENDVLQAEDSEDIHWSAFRYVMAEMDQAEATAFEALMDDNEVICLAVAAATQQVAVLAGAKETLSVRPVARVATPRASASGRWIASAVSICCCLAVICLMNPLAPETRQTETAATVSAEDTEILLDIWAENMIRENLDDADTGFDSEQHLDVPEWMVAGVSLIELDGTNGTDPSYEDLMPDDMEL